MAAQKGNEHQEPDCPGALSVLKDCALQWGELPSRIGTMHYNLSEKTNILYNSAPTVYILCTISISSGLLH